MKAFEYQIQAELVQLGFEKVVSQLCMDSKGKPIVATTRRPQEPVLAADDPRQIIPVGGRAEVMFEPQSLPSKEVFTRFDYDFTLTLPGQPSPASTAPAGELTQARMALVVQVRLYDAAGELVDAFEVPAMVVGGVNADHANNWVFTSPLQLSTQLAGATVRLVAGLSAVVAGTTTDPAQARFAVMQANAILKGLHQVFPVDLVSNTTADPIDLTDLIQSAGGSPVIRSGVVLDASDAALSLRLELGYDPFKQHSGNLHGDVAEWQKFYVQHPPDIRQGRAWGVLLPSDVIVRNAQFALGKAIQRLRERNIDVVWDEDTPVVWQPSGGISARMSGGVRSLNGWTLYGSTHGGVGIDISMTYDFRVESRTVTRNGSSESASVIVADLNVSVGVNDWDIFLTTLAYAGGLIATAAVLGAAIAGGVGAAVSAAIGGAIAGIVTGVVGGVTPGIVRNSLPTSSDGSSDPPITKLGDGHYEAVIDPMTFFDLNKGSPGKRPPLVTLVIDGGGQESRGLVLRGGLALAGSPFNIVGSRDGRIALVADSALQWTWARPCSAQPVLVARSAVTAVPGFGADLITGVGVDPADDPANAFGPNVTVRLDNVDGALASLPALASEVVIVVAVPETQLAPVTYPCVLRVSHTHGQSVVTLPPPPAIDDALRSELDAELTFRRRFCTHLGGTLVNGQTILLPTDDPPGWRPIGPAFRDRFDVVVSGLVPDSSVVVRAASLGPIAMTRARSTGHAVLSFDLPGARLGDPLEIHVDGGHPTWRSRRRRFVDVGRARAKAGERVCQAASDSAGTSVASILDGATIRRGREIWVTAETTSGTTSWRMIHEHGSVGRTTDAGAVPEGLRREPAVDAR